LHRGSHVKLQIMCLGADRHNSPAQLRALRQRDTRAKAEKKLLENPMGFDP
jgi:hypothetical protein